MINPFTIMLALGALVLSHMIWDIRLPDDEIKGYTVRLEEKGDESFLYAMNASAYRVSEKQVIENIGGLISTYDNCKIYDAENWTCTFSDDSATFGFRKGIYYIYSNTTKFPHLAEDPEKIGVSRFRFLLTKCGNGLRYSASSIISCIINPFTV